MSVCVQSPKYWSFSFSISPSKEHPGLIFCRMYWLDLLHQGSFPTAQVKSISSSTLSFLHSPTLTSIYDYQKKKKNIALTRWTFVGKVMSLLFNMLSRFIIAFIPSPHFLTKKVQENDRIRDTGFRSFQSSSSLLHCSVF